MTIKPKFSLFFVAAAIGGGLAGLTVRTYRREKQALLRKLAAGSTLIHTPQGTVETARMGQGPAVLVLHGTGGGYDMGRFFSRSDEGFEYIAISRPGYLRTPLTAGQTPDEQATLYAALLDELEIEQVAVLGLSAGGLSAIAFAAQYPQRCWALVLISAPSRPLNLPAPSFARIEKALRYLDFLVWLRNKLLSTTIIGGPGLREQLRLPPEVRTEIGRLMMTGYPFDQRISGIVHEIGQMKKAGRLRLTQVQAPTLVVHGEADSLVPFEHGLHSASQIPNARPINVPGGTHLVFVTHAVTLRPAVLQFLHGHKPKVEITLCQL